MPSRQALCSAEGIRAASNNEDGRNLKGGSLHAASITNGARSQLPYQLGGLDAIGLELQQVAERDADSKALPPGHLRRADLCKG